MMDEQEQVGLARTLQPLKEKEACCATVGCEPTVQLIENTTDICGWICEAEEPIRIFFECGFLPAQQIGEVDDAVNPAIREDLGPDLQQIGVAQYCSLVTVETPSHSI